MLICGMCRDTFFPFLHLLSSSPSLPPFLSPFFLLPLLPLLSLPLFSFLSFLSSLLLSPHSPLLVHFNFLPTHTDTECTYGCLPPVAPSNGRVANILQNGVGMVPGRGKIMLGAVAVFICYPGYYLHGSGSRKCVDNHIWTGQQPMCLPCECQGGVSAEFKL